MDTLVRTVLRRDTSDWRLRHACPACTYKLAQEPPMRFSMLYAMDGNDSLKRVIKRAQPDNENGDIGKVTEHPTKQKLYSDRYLMREFVDQWADRSTQDPLSIKDKVRCILSIITMYC